MKRFIEVTTVYHEKCSLGYVNRECQRLIDLNTVSSIFSNNEGYFVKLEDNLRFSVTNKSYNTIRDALLNGGLCGNGGTVSEMRSRIEYLEEHRNGGNSIADKLCDLQHDQTWIKQAVCNLIAMMKKENISYKPALLIGCNDRDLDVLFSDCYGYVRKMQERIKELEKKVGIKTEQKMSPDD